LLPNSADRSEQQETVGILPDESNTSFTSNPSSTHLARSYAIPIATATLMIKIVDLDPLAPGINAVQNGILGAASWIRPTRVPSVLLKDTCPKFAPRSSARLPRVDLVTPEPAHFGKSSRLRFP